MDHTTWHTSDEDIWLHLPRDNYVTALTPLADPGLRFPKTVANMASMSPITPNHIPHVSAPTRKLIDYSVINPTTVNVTIFHKCDVLHLSQKS